MARDTLLIAAFIAALYIAAGLLAIWPLLCAALRRADRQIDQWLSEEPGDQPRP